MNTRINISPTTRLLLAALCCACCLSAAPFLALAQFSQKAVLVGTVRNTNNAPVNFASVQMLETKEGRLTDKNGRFTFATATSGTVTLRIKNNSYETLEQAVELRAGDTTRLEFTLFKKVVTLKETVVGASAFSTSDIKTATLKPLDVVTTPGASADIFRALQTFPGVVNADDGSTLIVRGGDASETITLLDQATVVHPYRYESPSGGGFGTIPPFFVNGTLFTSGGFPARYGNALSGVLSMDSQNVPDYTSLQANLGTFGGSLGVNWVAIPDKLGIRFSGNRTDTRLLMAMNGLLGEFPTVPSSYDANLSVAWKYSGTGKIKLFNYLTHDELGVRVHQPSNDAAPRDPAHDGLYANAALNRIHSVQWTDVFDNWIVKASLSWNAWQATRSITPDMAGVFRLNLAPSDNTYKLRWDVEKDLTENVRVLFGQEVERSEYKRDGGKVIAVPSGELTFPFTQQAAANRWGGYAELETKFARQWLAGVGIRADYHTLAAQTTLDPRLSLRYAVDEFWNIRASWGIYHQFASMEQYATSAMSRINTGAENTLQAQQAQQFIVGVDYQEGDWLFRVEAYNKLYDKLVLPTDVSSSLNANFFGVANGFANIGSGFARGVDVFLKYGAYLVTPISGWFSYSYIRTERLQARDTGREIVYEQGPTPFDFTHNANLVLKYEVIPRLTVGTTIRYTTGAPVTPILSGLRQPDGSYRPVEAAVGSERLADVFRIDLSTSYFWQFSNDASLVFFATLSNLTNNQRILGYNYSADYSIREGRISTVRRTVVFGASLSWRL
jgi:outer membrane receptor for ferrienterochelin and colicin